jgi:predicted MFS family arabinose efflux permease
MVLATGVALGLVLGGLLLTADPLGLSWRPIFLINVPLGLLLLVAVPATLPRVGGLPGQGLDLPGVLTLGAGMVLLVAPLTFGPQERWPLWSRLGLAGAGLAGAGFVAVELLTLRRGRQPLLDLRTLLAPGVAAGLLVVLATMGSFGGFLFTISLYLQAGLGFTALAVGLTFLPYPAGFATVSLTWSRLAPARQRWLPTVGLTAMAAAVTVLALRPPSGWTPALIPVLVVAGAGHAASFSPLVARIAQGVGPERAAAFSALVTTTTQIAIVIGVALLGSLYLTAASSGRGLALVCAAVAAVTILGLPGSMRVAVRR